MPVFPPGRRRHSSRTATSAALAVGMGFATLIASRASAEVHPPEAMRMGQYEEALTAAAALREALPADEASWLIEIEALLVLGRPAEALTRITSALEESPTSLRFRLLGLEAARFAGHPEMAQEFLDQIKQEVLSRRRYVRDESHLVDLGEAALLLGAEPRLILENFLKRGQSATRPVRRAFLVAGQLALSKGDDALAARTFESGLRAFQDDPDLLAGLAAAFLDGDRSKLVEYAAAATAINPRHVPTRLLLAEHLIDAERLDAASVELDRALEVNVLHPEALALRAVIAHLRNDMTAARTLREKALSTWKDNPRVDHLIGTKLAQRYRFAEAAASLRQALGKDSLYTPARLELAQTLLRLGRDDEGWMLAHEAQKADPYSVTAFNLANLHDRVTQLAELRTDHFIVRMGADEAPVYGDRALALLERARERLTERYGLELPQPTTVEIFPDPKDFAVRTFGMPGVPGFLGVCFGPVVTVNSPATRRANWEAVLWHEFTHVITLALTRNRMPRWLSEGISVFEEIEENPAWGQRMTIAWHKRITEGRLRPIAAMSAAFLEAESNEDTQFAYFQSYLVVRFLIERHGFDRLRTLLAALGRGEEANAAIVRVYGPLDTLNGDFTGYAEAAARDFAGGLVLAEPENAASRMLASFNPNSYPAGMQRVEAAVLDRDWAKARTELELLTANDRYLPGEDSPHRLLAHVCRELGDREAEFAALQRIVAHEGDALEPVTRLFEISRERKDMSATIEMATRWIAIQPLAEAPWRALLTAHESTGQPREAANAGEVLLRLDPSDRAAIHHRIAQQLRALEPAAARKHVLLALEEAPRFRAAHALLAELPAGDPEP